MNKGTKETRCDGKDSHCLFVSLDLPLAKLQQRMSLVAKVAGPPMIWNRLPKTTDGNMLVKVISTQSRSSSLA